MKFVSFNVNSIRTRLHQLEAVIDQLNPDIIGLQETKVSDDQFPVDDVEALGYYVNFHGQKGHYGVALLSRQAPDEVHKGYPWDGGESQRRLIRGRFTVNDKTLTVINGYFPQGENRDHPVKFPAKEKFYHDLMKLLDETREDSDYLLVMGDMNIAPTDRDLGIGDANAKRWLREGKTCFLPEEREWMAQVEQRGLTDVFRHLHPQKDDTFSWFDYRSKGFERDPRRGLRIDLIMANDELLSKVRSSDVSYGIRAMERPSDHCPVWADFDL